MENTTFRTSWDLSLLAYFAINKQEVRLFIESRKREFYPTKEAWTKYIQNIIVYRYNVNLPGRNFCYIIVLIAYSSLDFFLYCFGQQGNPFIMILYFPLGYRE